MPYHRDGDATEGIGLIVLLTVGLLGWFVAFVIAVWHFAGAP